MWELRKDPVVGEWIVLSAARGKRPSDYNTRNTPEPAKPGPCAFCLGHENETGAELFAFREGSTVGAPDWRVRVVKNIYPAVSSELSPAEVPTEDESNVFSGCCIPGFGSHEVVIETPSHNVKMVQFTLRNVEEIFKSYRQRIKSLHEDARIKYVQVFKNQGKSGGASMEHSHSQIIALPIIPLHIELALNGAKRHYENTGSCVFCEMLLHDMNDGSRLIECGKDFVVIAPYAPKHPYEVWVLPRVHQSHFEMIDNSQLESLAGVLLSILMKMECLFGNTPYNYMLNTSPIRGYSNLPYYHWSVRIAPRLVTFGGFELGSGCHIVTVDPETTASEFRKANL